MSPWIARRLLLVDRRQCEAPFVECESSPASGRTLYSVSKAELGGEW